MFRFLLSVQLLRNYENNLHALLMKKKTIKNIFPFFGAACFTVMSCSNHATPESYEVIRNCSTNSGAARKCIVQYHTKPDGPEYYQYFFKAKEMEITVFEHIKKGGKLD